MATDRGPTALWGWEDTGPVWGARAFAPKSGQDHLGLGSVSSDRILPSLSPGINVLTIHPRYWSVYSWILDDFWSTDLPRTRSAFRDFYRPREALFSAACHVCDAPEHATLVANIVGSRRISPIADAAEFDPQFDYIKEPLGGYGLYYRSAMEVTGALIVAGPGNGFPFDAPTPVGRALAAAFRDAVAGTRIAGSWPPAIRPSPCRTQRLSSSRARRACASCAPRRPTTCRCSGTSSCTQVRLMRWPHAVRRCGCCLTSVDVAPPSRWARATSANSSTSGSWPGRSTRLAPNLSMWPAAGGSTRAVSTSRMSSTDSCAGSPVAALPRLMGGSRHCRQQACGTSSDQALNGSSADDDMGLSLPEVDCVNPRGGTAGQA